YRQAVMAKLTRLHFHFLQVQVGSSPFGREPSHLRNWSALTFSIQSTFLPFSDSVMAMCVIAVVAVAPCQCFSPGGNHTTSPGRTSSTGSPSVCTHPRPDVMISVWPSGCVCHMVRAPGSNVTWPPLTRTGSPA